MLRVTKLTEAGRVILVSGENAFFCATGVTNGSIVQGLRREPQFIETETILMRSKTGSVRRVFYRNPIR